MYPPDGLPCDPVSNSFGFFLPRRAMFSRQIQTIPEGSSIRRALIDFFRGVQLTNLKKKKKKKTKSKHKNTKQGGVRFVGWGVVKKTKTKTPPTVFFFPPPKTKPHQNQIFSFFFQLNHTPTQIFGLPFCCFPAQTCLFHPS